MYSQSGESEEFSEDKKDVESGVGTEDVEV